MFKRITDVLGSLTGLLIFSWVLVPVLYLIWRQDHHSPFYIAERTGINGTPFKMVKLRSMIINASASGVDSTSNDDVRITSVGRFVRKYKLDELAQLWNVLIGDMSLVGPRPNVTRETELYTFAERELLSVKPGITDFASIVFADEGSILEGFDDPDLAYHQLIRPGKGELGLFYVANRTFLVDLLLVALTALALISRARALKYVSVLVGYLGGGEDLQKLCLRLSPLVPRPPPGASKVVQSRDGEISDEQ